MRSHDQYEARLAFGLAVLVQLFALLIPSNDRYPPLLKEWWAQMAFNVSHRSLKLLMSDVFFIGANLLWLVSPFLARVYGQSKPLRVLAMALSLSVVAWMAFWLVATRDTEPYQFPLLLAAVAHVAGMFTIRKESAEQERPV